MGFLDSFLGLFSAERRMRSERRRKAREELERLIATGRIQKVLLMPAEFSGEDRPENTTYLTPEAAAQKRAFDARVRKLVEQGKDVQCGWVPEYDDEGMIPARLQLRASVDGKAMDETIHVNFDRSPQQGTGRGQRLR